MIKFFRKIRYDLMEQNKTGKYLKYTIGEIVLVVIGILIALSINNWNENRKNKAFEREMLSQIQANLTKDKSTLSQIANNGANATKSAQRILDEHGSLKNNDSLKYWLGDVIQFDRFHPLTNAYEMLKSKGLDQVQNKQLRFLLGTYYDDKATHIIKAVADVEYEFTTYWLPSLRKHLVDFEFKEYLIINNTEIFSPPSEIRNALILHQNNHKGSIKYIDEGIEIIGNIMSLIDQELKNNLKL